MLYSTKHKQIFEMNYKIKAILEQSIKARKGSRGIGIVFLYLAGRQAD
jgi:hypothetical protein